MSSLSLTSGWYYICTLYYTPDKKDVRPYNRFKREIYTKKRENLFLGQKRERRSERVFQK